MKSKKKASVGRGVGRSAAAMAEREHLFIEAYIANGGDGAKAARAAGYANSGAGRRAVDLLRRPNVVKALAARREKLARRYELTSESVIAELAKIVHSDITRLIGPNGKYLPVSQWPDDMRAAVASVEFNALGQVVNVRLWSKDGGFDRAMKNLGLYEVDNRQKASALADVLADLDGKDTGLPGRD